MGRNFENRKNAIFKTAAQKTKLYSKYAKQLYVVAKNGVPNPRSQSGVAEHGGESQKGSDSEPRH